MVTDISRMEGPEGERVLLLKGERGDAPPGSGGASDAYKDLLEREGFHVTLVPVLQFNFVNSSLVSPMLASPAASSLVYIEHYWLSFPSYSGTKSGVRHVPSNALSDV